MAPARGPGARRIIVPSRFRTRSSGPWTRARVGLRAGFVRVVGTVGIAALGAGASVGAACSPAVHSFGDNAAGARENADALFLGLARRFGPHSRDERLKEVRPKLLRSFLTPTTIWRDSAMWSSSRDSTRTLAVAGAIANGSYVLAKVPDVGRPHLPGVARHLMHLTHVEGEVYEWTSTDQLAVGYVDADELHAVLTRALESFERHDQKALRAAIPAAFPRSSAALGRLFSVERLETEDHDDGSATVEIGIRLDPARIRRESPRLATYLERYVSSAKYALRLEDEGGMPWLAVRLQHGLLTLRWRTHGGKLQPFDGPIREAPSVFRMRASAAVKVFLFTVGASDIAGELHVINRPGERGWEIVMREEPDWQLPLAGERLLRSPLRRPFEGEGALVRYVARDSAGAQTLLVRDIRAQVQESAALRFLNSLGNKMASDLDEPTEAELQKFTSEAILALHRDVTMFLPADSRITDGKAPGGDR